MNFEITPRAERLRERVSAFMEEHVYPAEPEYEAFVASAADRWTIPPVMEELKAKAKGEGLWNLFVPRHHDPDALSNVEYAHLCEVMGRSPIGAEPFNCSAPDTGNMETLIRYATDAQKERWLQPLMEGEIRSCFAMTEPAVASSDATNIQTEIRRDGDSCVINGRKWWITGAPDPRCRISILMGKTDISAEKHRQQSMILVPMDTPGITIVRPLTVFGYDDAPARPCRDRLPGRARAGLQHPARRRPRLRDRAGAARAGPHPPLHALDRGGRTRAGGRCASARSPAIPSASRSPTRG